MELIRGKINAPYKICIYGQAGVGKSTLATQGDDVIFFDMEMGLDRVDCARTPVIHSSKDLYAYVKECLQGKMGKTYAFDSADALEKIFVGEICQEHKIKAIGELGFGKGYEHLNNKWQKFLDMLDVLKGYGINSIVIGHEIVKRFEDPRAEGYDRILLKMHQKSAGTLISRMDAVLYMSYELTVVKGDKNAKSKALGKGDRVLHTSERPAFVAKNRYDMPDKMKPEQLFSFLPKQD